ncbi:hypothetical protein O181_089466 [Austropuccinia psidii MF-1]|uniref:Response regulatory domain-containing protein n=1 Tax=Austropuccinia psidii MF-1 TaxID=1389203 RepID=A0A9Q3ITM9_9BASI|nr:hypothetical protein [Austropuccinia psidii MF-1]
MSQKKLKVLIVDDNLLNLKLIQQILIKKLLDWIDVDHLRLASSGKIALGILNDHPIDLVFLDISMPEISGIEVCKILRNKNHLDLLHLCAVTTDLDHWKINLYHDVGMNGVIGKPLKYLDLQFALETCQNNLISNSISQFYFRQYGLAQPIQLASSSFKQNSSNLSATLRPDPKSKFISLNPSSISSKSPSPQSTPPTSLPRRNSLTSHSTITTSSLTSSALPFNPSSQSISHFPALATAPTFSTLKFPQIARHPRRSASMSNSSYQPWFQDQEQDVFAAGFAKAFQAKQTSYQKFTSFYHYHLRNPIKIQSDSTQPQKNSIESNQISNLTLSKKTLLTRRSHPEFHDLLKSQNNHRNPPNSFESRKTKSRDGSPIRPTWQLIQLNLLSCQSVFKSNDLFNEIL